MNAFAALFICVAFALLVRALSHSYFYLPKNELKRQTGPVYKRIQMVAKYGFTAKLFLGSVTFFFGAAATIIASRSFDPLAALIVLAGLFVLLKAVVLKNFYFTDKSAAALAPYISKILFYIHPVVDLIKDILPGSKKARPRTDIYETEDLQDLLRTQQRARNNRIPHPELIAALNALEFGGKRIKDHMAPLSKIHFVNTKDTVGPILLSELHKSGFTSFPVKGNSENEIAGMLYLHDLASHTEGGAVSEFMEEKAMYLRQDKPLEAVLQGFSITGRHEFMIVDETAKITGMINLKEVLEQMIGHSVKSGFEDYDNPSAVASE